MNLELSNKLPSIPETVPNLKKESSTSLCGPCPKCGGKDRFWFNTEKQKFSCRGCYEGQGDLIDFHKWLYDKSFKELCHEYGVGNGKPGAVNFTDFLTNKRGISQALVQDCIKAGLIWGQKYGEPAMPVVGVKYKSLDGKTTDSGGVKVMQFIPLDGSEKKFKSDSRPGEELFFIAGQSPDKAGTIVLTEGVIDALSAVSVRPDVCGLALGSSALYRKAAALKKYQIKIVIAHDNDEPGEKFKQKVVDALGGGFAVQWAEDDPKDLNDLLRAGRSDRIKELVQAAVAIDPINEDSDAAPGPDPEQVNKFAKRFISGADLDKQFMETLNQGHLIEGVLPENSFLILLYGSPGTFKSFIALDMSLSISAGIKWQGHKTKQCHVLYSAAEGQAGALKRIYAWKKYHGIKSLDNFTLMPMPCLVDNKLELDQFINAIKSMPVVPAVVVLDTLARSMSGDENSTSDMGKIVQAAGRITEETGAQVLIVHHTGKDEKRGPRGAIALLGATDTMFYLCKTDHLQTTMICERQKDNEPFTDMVFAMDIIETGFLDVDMQPVTSLVPILDPDAVKERKSKQYNKIKGANLIALKALQEALKTHGEAPGPDVKMQMHDDPLAQCGQVVHEDVWRKVAYSMSISDRGQDAKQKAFTRARTKLIELEKVKTWDDFYWIL